MKNKVFLRATILLIVCNLIGKVIGAVYRIPLAGILGGEGMGQYQLTFPLYCLILTISTSGIPVAISKMVAEFNSTNSFQNSKKLLKISLIILTLISAVSAVIVALGAKVISSFQGNPDIYICYYGIAPAVLFVGILSAFRGYFQGNLVLFPTAFSGLIEQIAKLGFGLFFANRLLTFGVPYAVLGAILGISLAELIACLFLIVCYLFYQKKQKTAKNSSTLPTRQLSKKLFAMSVPITLGGMVSPLSTMIDSLLVVNLLMFVGYSSSTATMMLGLQSGIVEPLINIPVVIAVSISTVVLPSLSSLKLKEKNEEANEIIVRAFEISLSISITCLVLFIIFGEQILEFLYGSSLGGFELSIALKLLFIGAINIVFLSLVQVSAGVLQGLSHQKFPVFAVLISCLVKIVLDVLLILNTPANIYAVSISAGVSYVVSFTLCFFKIKKLVDVSLVKSLANVIIQQAFVCLFAYFANKMLKVLFGGTISLFASGLIAGIIFLITFYLFFFRFDVRKKSENKLA